MKGVRRLFSAYSRCHPSAPLSPITIDAFLELDSKLGLGLTLHELELPSPTTGHPNVSYPSELDNIMESLHRLLDRSLGVESVALEDVHVV